MSDIEDKLRRALNAHLDPIEVQRSLPSDVRVRAGRGRAVLIGAGVFGTIAVMTAAAIAIPSLGTGTQERPGVGNRASALPIVPHEIIPRENGRIIYSLSSGGGMKLHSMRPNGSGDRVIPTPPGEPWLHAWSPDGSRLAVAIFPSTGERTIWVMNADGSDAHQVAAAENVSAPAWSPDGTTIVYSARTERRTAIHLVAADGSEDRVIHGEGAEGTFAIFSAQFSPDGTKILFDRGTDSGFDIFVMDADGSDVRRLTTTGTDLDPSWSPDGTQIAFTRQEVASSDIFMMNADGDEVQRLTDGGNDTTNVYPQWAPDGTKIAYLAGITGGPGALVVMNPDASDPVELVRDEVLGISWQSLPISNDP